MKNLITWIILILIATFAVAALACTTNTIYGSDGRTQTCTTCCYGNQCTTTCY